MVVREAPRRGAAPVLPGRRRRRLTGVYTGLAQLVVLVLVLLFALSPAHSWRARLVVGGLYLLAVGLPRLAPVSPLVSLLLQVLLGIVLIIWRRWEKGPKALF